MLTPFTARVALFSLLIVSGQYMLSSFFPTHMCPPHLFDDCLNGRDDTILYFGDSTTFTAGDDEPNKQDMAEILQALYPQLDVEPVFRTATTARVFSAVLESRLRRGLRPRLVVIDAHLGLFTDAAYHQRNFREGWRRNVITFSTPLLRAWWRPAETFRLDAPMTHQERARLPIFYQGKRVGRLGDANDEGLTSGERQKLHVYATLVNQPEKVKLLPIFLDMLSLAREYKVPILVYFTPMNYSLATELAGPDVVKLMGVKRDYLVERMEAEGAEVLDLMLDLDKSHFLVEMLDHHLRYSGRVYVARRVGQRIVEMFDE